jgi:pimeloyl-ACP methyl ester carboxylesterase
MLPRLPWRIAVERTRPQIYRCATPMLCLPQVAPAVRQRLHRQGHEVWRFDFLGSGASDHCLGGEPDRLRQMAAVLALMQAVTGAPRAALVVQECEAGLAETFAAAYPFVVERLVAQSSQGEQDEQVQYHRRDFRSTAA